MALSMTSAVLGAGLSAQTFRLKRTSRRSVRLQAPRAEKGLGEQIEEKTKAFVDATRENSGLDNLNLNEQPGNRSQTALGEIQTPKGDISEVMSFSGLLPETINGRASMLGMLAAFGAEVSTHEPILKQIQYAPVAVAAAFITIVVASLAPVVRNANLDIDGAGPFTRKAETINGRLAMVAFALTIAVETFRAGPGLVP